MYVGMVKSSIYSNNLDKIDLSLLEKKKHTYLIKSENFQINIYEYVGDNAKSAFLYGVVF